MVDQVRARGPFFSLADFINRDPESSNIEERRRSPLQAALDLSVNSSSAAVADDSGDTFGELRGIPAQPVQSYSEAHNDEDYQGMGFPGWVLQADLLQHLAPCLAARSDTFKIRSVGSYSDPATGNEVRAYLETVVQRVPEPIGATASTAQLITTDNDFGRQFRIISMRWLSEDQI